MEPGPSTTRPKVCVPRARSKHRPNTVGSDEYTTRKVRAGRAASGGRERRSVVNQSSLPPAAATGGAKHSGASAATKRHSLAPVSPTPRPKTAKDLRASALARAVFSAGRRIQSAERQEWR